MMKRFMALIAALLILTPVYAAQLNRLHDDSITNGAVVNADDLNDEFDQLLNESNSQDTRLDDLEGGNSTLSGTKTFTGIVNFSAATNFTGLATFNGAIKIARPSDPSTLSDGMLWYNETSDVLKIRMNGRTVSLNPIDVMGFRLTLQSGVPVSTTDQSAKTTVYMTPYKGSQIALYNGTQWNNFESAEISVAVPSNTNTPFDVFAYDNAGVVALETLAWTNDTTRATALVYQNGVLVKSGDTTRRYIGTGRTTAVNGQTADADATRYLWNYYNRVNRMTRGTFSANRSTTSTSFTELNTEIRTFWVTGVAEDCVYGSVNGTVSIGSPTTALTGVSFDAAATEAGFTTGVGNSSGATLVFPPVIHGTKCDLAPGGHYATLVGATSNGASATWHGSTVPTAPSMKVYLTVGTRQ